MLSKLLESWSWLLCFCSSCGYVDVTTCKGNESYIFWSEVSLTFKYCVAQFRHVKIWQDNLFNFKLHRRWSPSPLSQRLMIIYSSVMYVCMYVWIKKKTNIGNMLICSWVSFVARRTNWSSQEGLPYSLLVMESNQKTRSRMIKCNCGLRSSAGVTWLLMEAFHSLFHSHF